MSDDDKKEFRRETMKSVKTETTTLALKVAKELWRKGIRFRRNVEDLPGTPDIAIKKLKLVIFVDSCFWHGCKLHCKIPSTNKEFWHSKIERNRKIVEETNDYYINNGWTILRIWEHDIRNNFDETINSIMTTIKELKGA